MSPLGSVLLVEDDPSLRSAYRLILEARGLTVRDASTLREAVAALRSTPADAVVLDLGLPDSDGADGARTLREEAPHTAMVVLTGRDEPELRRRCRDAGVSAFRVKPMGGVELGDLMDELLGGSGG